MSDGKDNVVEPTTHPEQSFILIVFDAPGSAMIKDFQTVGVSLVQLVLGAHELETIVTNERWWNFYSQRMAGLAQISARQQVEEEMLRAALSGKGPMMRSG